MGVLVEILKDFKDGFLSYLASSEERYGEGRAVPFVAEPAHDAIGE
jgi:hypothetical protein